MHQCTCPGAEPVLRSIPRHWLGGAAGPVPRGGQIRDRLSCVKLAVVSSCTKPSTSKQNTCLFFCAYLSFISHHLTPHFSFLGTMWPAFMQSLATHSCPLSSPCKCEVDLTEVQDGSWVRHLQYSAQPPHRALWL
jgi:hypothetical protein